MKNISYLLFGLLLFCSCTKLLEMEGPAHEPRQVLSSVFFADSVWHVQLTSSISIMEGANEFPPIKNATLKLYENGEWVGNLEHTGNGVYSSSTLRPVAGNHYRIVSAAPGFPEIEAEDRVPEAFECTLSGYAALNLPKNKHLRGAVFTLKKEEEPAYYFVSKFSNHFGGNYVAVNLYDEGNKQIEMVTDQQSTGEEAIQFTLGYYPECKPEDGSTFYMGRTGKAYYEYFKTFSHQMGYEEDIFKEPGAVYSNVKGGYGLFAGCNFQVLEFDQTHFRPDRCDYYD